MFYIDINMVTFHFLNGDVPRRPSYGVYISQLIRFARVCSHVDDFNASNKGLTANFGKELPTLLAVCAHCIVSICNFSFSRFGFEGGVYSSCSLLTVTFKSCTHDDPLY